MRSGKCRHLASATRLLFAGAGEGNRTLDTELGKLACLQSNQRVSDKTRLFGPFLHQRVRFAIQNQKLAVAP